MKSARTHVNLTLATPSELSDSKNLLTRLTQASPHPSTSNPLKPFISLDDCLLSDLAKVFDSTDDVEEPPLDILIDSFIHKYETPTYQSLDELLDASIKTPEYRPQSVKSLSDVLDGLINDL
ncbi:MAG: hypothetical protein ACRC1P_05715 [Cellulosilyticaceae bacterium]